MPRQKKNKQTALDVEISLQDLVEVLEHSHLKWSKRWINKLVKEKNYPKSKSRGKYPLALFLLRIIEDQHNELLATKDSGKKSDFEALREKYKAYKEEIEYKKLLGSIISINDYQNRIETIVRQISSQLNMLRRKGPNQLANKNTNEIKEGLDKLIVEIENELADITTYGLRLDNNAGSIPGNGRSRKKNVKTVSAKKKTNHK